METAGGGGASGRIPAPTRAAVAWCARSRSSTACCSRRKELFLIEERSQHSLRAFAMRREPCRAGTGSILIPRVGTAEALLLLRVAAQRGAEDKVEDDTNENVQMLRAWNVRRGALPVEGSRSDPRGAKIDFCVRTAHCARELFKVGLREKKKKREGGKERQCESSRKGGRRLVGVNAMRTAGVMAPPWTSLRRTLRRWARN